MAIEVNSTNIVCSRCGKSYSRRKGNFAVNYGVLYKGIGYLTVCKNCVDDMYNTYLAQCNNSKDAVRQVCRKLDLYWNEKVFDIVEKKTATRTMMTSYLAKITTVTYAGKSYDDTLSDEGVLWNFQDSVENNTKTPVIEEKVTEEVIDVPKELIKFWGTSLNPNDYFELENKRQEWYSSFTDESSIGVSTKNLIKQICLLELDMDKERANGGSPSDKTIKSYTDLLGSANLKPVQKQKDENDSSLLNTPMGVWLYRYENKRPLPDKKYSDSPLLRYVFIWMGHVLRMLGKKNGYEKMYQDEIDRLRVEKPEYDGDDDEILLTAYMEESGETDG